MPPRSRSPWAMRRRWPPMPRVAARRRSRARISPASRPRSHRSFVRSCPSLLGLRSPATGWLPVPFWLGLPLVFAIVASFVALRERPFTPFFHFLLVITPLLFLLSGAFVDAQSYRYLMPVSGALAVVLALGVWRIFRWSRVAGAVSLAMILTLFGLEQRAWYRELAPDAQSAAIIECLDRIGARTAVRRLLAQLQADVSHRRAHRRRTRERGRPVSALYCTGSHSAVVAENHCYNGTLVHTRYVFLALSLLCVAAPARAELVFFASGRTLNVKSHRSEGGSLVLTLRSGGEVVCDPALIDRIAPDEAPYPEPVVEEIRLKAEPTTGQCVDCRSWDPASAGFGGPHRSCFRAGRRGRASGPGRHRGGIGIPAAGPVAEGRHGADAVDARDRAPVRGEKPVRSGREHRSRHQAPQVAAGAVSPGPGPGRLQRRRRRRRALRRHSALRRNAQLRLAHPSDSSARS